jgi:hypothetical protein
LFGRLNNNKKRSKNNKSPNVVWVFNLHYKHHVVLFTFNFYLKQNIFCTINKSIKWTFDGVFSIAINIIRTRKLIYASLCYIFYLKSYAWFCTFWHLSSPNKS